jgi:hypothetical protein
MPDALGEVGCTRYRFAAHKFCTQTVQLRYGAFEGVVAEQQVMGRIGPFYCFDDGLGGAYGVARLHAGNGA